MFTGAWTSTNPTKYPVINQPVQETMPALFDNKLLFRHVADSTDARDSHHSEVIYWSGSD